MNSMDVSVIQAIKDYGDMIRHYPFFFAILVAVIIGSAVLWINKSNKTTFYLTLGICILFAGFSIYFKGMDLIDEIETIFAKDFYKNIYFYYWNMFVAFFFLHHKLSSSKIDRFERIFLLCFFIGLTTNSIFQFYMVDVVHNIPILVIGNTYPMIIVGNLLSFLFYLYVLVHYVVGIFQKDRRK